MFRQQSFKKLVTREEKRKKTQKNTKKHNTDDVCGEREKSEQMDKNNMKPIGKTKKKEKIEEKEMEREQTPKDGRGNIMNQGRRTDTDTLFSTEKKIKTILSYMNVRMYLINRGPRVFL